MSAVTARRLRPVVAAPHQPRRQPQPRPEPRPRPNLRAVPDAPPSRAVVWIAGAVAGTVLLLGVIGIVALNALAAEASFRARALEDDISALTLQHDDLVAAVAELESPERVRAVAIEQLGLIEPEAPGFLRVDPADLPRPAEKPAVRLGR